ncbi:hypothetical protein BH20PSE1_BH20PSE1_11390 [soil metagenome]
MRGTAYPRSGSWISKTDACTCLPKPPKPVINKLRRSPNRACARSGLYPSVRSISAACFDPVWDSRIKRAFEFNGTRTVPKFGWAHCLLRRSLEGPRKVSLSGTWNGAVSIKGSARSFSLPRDPCSAVARIEGRFAVMAGRPRRRSWSHLPHRESIGTRGAGLGSRHAPERPYIDCLPKSEVGNQKCTRLG